MTYKIALCGKMRAGKDVVAKYLVEHYGYERFAFGDELKRYYRELYGDAGGHGAKERGGLQWFGQTLRQRDEDVWVRKCFDKIEQYRQVVDWYEQYGLGAFRPVITDIRQPNELVRCRAEGYVIIKVEADETTRLERIKARGDDFTLGTLRHETELFVDEIEADYTINNSGGVTLEALHAQVDAIMADITKGAD